MTFIHGYLLVGLLLVGVPILVHLIMRQKPKQLPFPAMRFLRQRHLQNRRRLRLRHLLLLALRMAVIAALCVALARPLLSFHILPGHRPRAVAAVFLFDTSPSMGYVVDQKTRLDEARQQALDLLKKLPRDSQVLILDTADEPGGQWLGSRDLIESRLKELRVREANGPLNRQLPAAFQMLAEAGAGDDPPPRVLYVFSDRTRACWEPGESSSRARPEGVAVTFVDVGVSQPRDLAVDDLKVEPAVAAPGARVRLLVTVRATGSGMHKNRLVCQGTGFPPTAAGESGPTLDLRVTEGDSQIHVFEGVAPLLPNGVSEASFQVRADLVLADDLLFNNSRYATFRVRTGRKVLVIADQRDTARPWEAALRSVANERPADGFPCDICTTAEAASKDLGAYRVICLFQAVQPSAALWKKLAAHVKGGGGLVLVPGGDELLPHVAEYNRAATAAGLLPATLETISRVPPDKPGLRWGPFGKRHPVPAFFQNSLETGTLDYDVPGQRPQVRAYWRVEPLKGAAMVFASYANGSPALVERGVGKGHVILFTTPLDLRLLDPGKPGSPHWHNYWQDSSFGIVLVDRICRYLSGDSLPDERNYLCGQAAELTLPTPLPPQPYSLRGPGLTPAETNVAAAEGETTLTLLQALVPGNYELTDKHEQRVAGFSLNVRREESLLEQVPAADVEAVLGPGAFPTAGQGLRLPSEPDELLPWLMMLLLVGLCIESLLANRFYRNPAPDPASAAGGGECEGGLPPSHSPPPPPEPERVLT